MKIELAKLSSTAWTGTVGPPQIKIKDKVKHLCEEWNDGSKNIPNFLNGIVN